jgi:3'(2'), 5'-bisphosphate nucleotidase
MEENKIRFVNNLLFTAGDAILKIYNSNDFNTSLKADNSPVTAADKTSSMILNEGLKKIFSEIPVIDEETTIPGFEIRKKWDSFFLVDPLDGTKEFIKKNGEFCINLALIQKNIPVAGWIYQPITGKGWFAEKENGISEFERSGGFCKIKPEKVDSEKLRIVISRSFFNPREEEIINRIAKGFPVEIIHMGSSIKQIALVLGKADMYLKAGPCSEWDTAPGQLMVEESGGVVLCHNNFLPLGYNKPVLSNPDFVMLNLKLNTPGFINDLQNIIQN